MKKLTSELADWLGLDAGHLAEGKRADIAVVDPHALSEKVDQAVEAPMEGIPGFLRMVRRNDDAVKAVFVAGKLAVKDGNVLPEVGQKTGFGRFLRGATAKADAPKSAAPSSPSPSGREKPLANTASLP